MKKRSRIPEREPRELPGKSSNSTRVKVIYGSSDISPLESKKYKLPGHNDSYPNEGLSAGVIINIGSVPSLVEAFPEELIENVINQVNNTSNNIGDILCDNVVILSYLTQKEGSFCDKNIFINDRLYNIELIVPVIENGISVISKLITTDIPNGENYAMNITNDTRAQVIENIKRILRS